MSEDAPRDEMQEHEELEHQHVEEPQAMMSEGVHIPISGSTESQTSDIEVVPQDEFSDTSRTTDEFVPSGDHVNSEDTGNRPENGGWDIAKAETMASVLRESPGFIEDSDKLLSLKIEDQEDRATQDRLKEEAERHRATGEEIPSDLSSRIDELGDSIRERQEKIRIAKFETDWRAEFATDTYQELYDINPSMFADMPTSEFMKIAQEYQVQVLIPLAEQESLVSNVQKCIDEIEQCLEQKRGVPIATIDRGISFALKAAGIGSVPEVSEFKDKFSKVYEGSTDKTIGEIMEEQIALFKDSFELAETRTQRERERLSSFLRKYQPKNPLENQDS